MMNLWEKESIPLYDEEKGQIPTMEAFLIDPRHAQVVCTKDFLKACIQVSKFLDGIDEE